MSHLHVRAWLRGGASTRLALMPLAATLLLAGASQAAMGSAIWELHSLSNTTVAPGGVINYHLVVMNVGDAPAPATTGGDANNCVPGSPPPSDPAKCFIVRADLPPQLTPLGADTQGGPACTVQGASIVCPYTGSTPAQQFGFVGSSHTIVFSARVNPGVDSGTVTAAFQVAGGEAANVGRTVDPTLVSATPPPFGIDAFDAQVTADAAGDAQTQAGAHPFEAATDIVFNSANNSSTPVGGDLYTVASTRDIVVDLPAGFVGDTTAADRCTADQLANGESFTPAPLCPATSQVGSTLVMLANGPVGEVLGPLPVFNMVPPRNVPARLGFNVSGTVVTLDATLRTGGDYGLRATVRDVSELRVQGTE